MGGIVWLQNSVQGKKCISSSSSSLLIQTGVLPMWLFSQKINKKAYLEAYLYNTHLRYIVWPQKMKSVALQ